VAIGQKAQPSVFNHAKSMIAEPGALLAMGGLGS
jgi:hypothetical protein